MANEACPRCEGRSDLICGADERVATVVYALKAIEILLPLRADLICKFKLFALYATIRLNELLFRNEIRNSIQMVMPIEVLPSRGEGVKIPE